MAVLARPDIDVVDIGTTSESDDDLTIIGGDSSMGTVSPSSIFSGPARLDIWVSGMS